MEIAQAIVEARGEQPDYDVDESRNWWPYKDFTDMNQRISDYAGVKIGNEASEYLIFTPAEDSVFKIRVIGESAGVRHEVQAEGYVKDNKVRYIKWRED